MSSMSTRSSAVERLSVAVAPADASCSSLGPHPSQRHTRLTRRGRLLLLLLVVGLAMVAFSLGRVSVGAATRAPRLRSVVVGAGGTLWGIAETVAPQVDPRVEVAILQRVNHLTSSQLMAGQELLVPVSAP